MMDKGSDKKITAGQYTFILTNIAVISDDDREGAMVYATGYAPPMHVPRNAPGFDTLMAWAEQDDKIRVHNKILVLANITAIWQDRGAVCVHMAGHAPMQSFEPGDPGLVMLLAWSQFNQWTSK